MDIFVEPSGDTTGGTDTANIQAAFDQHARARRGSELSRMTKAQLAAIVRQGGAWFETPPERWGKDELINEVLLLEAGV